MLYMHIEVLLTDETKAGVNYKLRVLKNYPRVQGFRNKQNGLTHCRKSFSDRRKGFKG